MFNIKSASPMWVHLFIAVFGVLVLGQWGHCDSGASFVVVPAVTSPTNDAKENGGEKTKCDRELDILKQFSSRLGDMEVPANQELLCQALETHYKIMLARKRQEVNEQGVIDLTSLRNQAVEFYKAGVVPKTDVLAAEVQLAVARGKVEQFGAEIDRLTTQLNFILKYPLNREWKTKVRSELPMVPFSYPESEICRVAVEHRPDLLQKGISFDQATRALFEDGPNSERTALVREIMVRASVEYQEMKRLWNVVPVRRTAVEYAAEAFRINQNKYKDQVATYTEVLDSQRACAQTQEDYYIDLINYKVKRASLERQLGILHLFELSTNRNGQ
ncbi:MAG: TolC family protein [Thermodesulfobacteriota bacterium]